MRIRSIVKADMANKFFSKYHYIASGGRGGKNIGLMHNGTLITCTRFCSPTIEQSATRLGLRQQDIKKLTRFVIKPTHQKENLASWFLSKCVKLIQANIY